MVAVLTRAQHQLVDRWKRTLYKLFESPTSSQSAFIIHVASTTAIVFSACVTILETLPPFHATPTHVWFGIETSLVVLFTVEYIARLLAHSETWGDLFRWCGCECFSIAWSGLDRSSYFLGAKAFFAIVDLLAILPYFIEIAIQADTVRRHLTSLHHSIYADWTFLRRLSSVSQFFEHSAS